MTTLVMVATVIAGFLAYSRMPISNLPNVTYPTIEVSVSFPGMTPDTMAHAVALPLEKQFMAIPGVKLVSSNNTLGPAASSCNLTLIKIWTRPPRMCNLRSLQQHLRCLRIFLMHPLTAKSTLPSYPSFISI